ncbi:MAG: PBP1A family penicillin-binding protein, partial [Bdellovibrionales bacterium]|nr:PBP1A family penicillin-binding protein [Bdellovibrionales bacterium]
MVRKFVKFFFIISIIVGLLATAAGLLAGMYFYIRLTRDLPKIEQLSDYRPKAVTSLYADDGTLIAEVYDERRYPVTFDEIPERVRQAFLAAEDANFYRHPGIDIISILRAMWVNLRSKTTRQGASTITQQIVKSLLLSREKTYERKAKEAILSYRLEKALTKDEIFSIYLNEIFLGAGSYGVKAAARVHFRKELDQLTNAEAAYLAGLPQKPSELTRPENRDAALRRQRYVLDQMLENRFISREEHDIARAETITIYPPENHTLFAAPYFASHSIRVLEDIFRDQIEGTATPTNPGGYEVRTTVNLRAYELARRSLRRALREIDKRRGWRGPIGSIDDDAVRPTFEHVDSISQLVAGDVYHAVVKQVDAKSGQAIVELGALSGTLNLKKAEWARRIRTKEGKIIGGNPAQIVKPGDVIEASLVLNTDKRVLDKNGHQLVKLKLDQTPDIQGAMAVQNALTGEVKAVIGGYDYQQSVFNRATQGKLQPGSAFKPFIYLAAVEHLNYTPSTIVPDSPISMVAGNGKVWAPQNYDHKYLGPITLRTALQRSRNVVSVYLLQRLGVQRGIQSARKLGITTPIAPNMSIALGTAEVRLIELVRAYGAFAAEGWLADQIFVKSIRDRNGTLVYEKRTKQQKVIEDADAFIMANMMKGVVERGTAQKVKELGRPVAGKTGTTNDQMDAWFVGYTPEWVSGVWVGFDVKQSIGRFETGGKAAAPAFLYFMKEWLKDVPDMDFNIPDGVIPVAVNLQSGRLTDPDAPGA